MDTLTPFTPMKLLRHAPTIERMLQGEIVYPISIEIDLSNVCPHDCPFCSFGTSTSQGYRQQNWVTFPPARMLRLLDEMAECGVRSLTFTGGGEPLVHRQAAAIFEKASEHFEWGLVTNGLLLKDAVATVIAGHAKFVRVSLDAGTPETHHLTHGLPDGQFQYYQILDNMRALREKADHYARAERLAIGASFCVMDQNWREIYQAAKHVKDHGGDYLEVRPTYPTEWRGDGWAGGLEPPNYQAVGIELQHARLHLEDAAFRIIGMADRFENAASQTPIKRYEKCRIGDLTTVIGADGRGWHCCVNRGVDYFTYGSFLDSSFKAVWESQARRRMIEGIDISKCPRCRYDPLNETIEQGFIQDRMHANFL
jgi:MoaA/NifB/PqqE/SkfB family radical SAM enzyme